MQLKSYAPLLTGIRHNLAINIAILSGGSNQLKLVLRIPWVVNVSFASNFIILKHNRLTLRELSVLKLT